MNIVIVGAGRMGREIAFRLADEGHDITVVDNDAGCLEQVANTIDAMTLLGNGADYSVLSEAGCGRSALSAFLEKLTPKDNVHVIGGLEINEDTVEVSVDGVPVKMTPIEYKILLLLAKNPGRVFSSEEIYERVWQEKAINTDTIMVHVRNIREKIELDPKNPKYLKVVWGVGYKIDKQP